MSADDKNEPPPVASGEADADCTCGGKGECSFCHYGNQDVGCGTFTNLPPGRQRCEVLGKTERGEQRHTGHCNTMKRAFGRRACEVADAAPGGDAMTPEAMQRCADAIYAAAPGGESPRAKMERDAELLGVGYMREREVGGLHVAEYIPAVEMCVLYRKAPGGEVADLLDRETLGKLVREVWIAWAREQPSPKPSWLVPWDGLAEPDREVDRRIGETVARAAVQKLTASNAALRRRIADYEFADREEAPGLERLNALVVANWQPGISHMRQEAAAQIIERLLAENAALTARVAAAEGANEGLRLFAEHRGESIRSLRADLQAARAERDGFERKVFTTDCACGHHGWQHREEEGTGAARECQIAGCPCNQFCNVHMALKAARDEAAEHWQRTVDLFAPVLAMMARCKHDDEGPCEPCIREMLERAKVRALATKGSA